MRSEQFTCDHCGHVCDISELTEFDGQDLCSDCISEHTAICSHCGERYWLDDDAGDENTFLCRRCYENYYTHCDHCGRLLHQDDAYYEDSDDDEAGESESAAKEIMAIANRRHDHLYCKHDGSLNDGIELVSHPMTLKYHMSDMPWAEVLRKAVNLGYLSHQRGTCGLHVHPKRGRIERLPEQDETFYSIEEAQDDVFTAISAALDARNDDIYVVRGQVGIGKSSSYLRLISENPTSRFLVAAPTNLLKDELYNKAKGMGIDVKRTPSLEQIKDEIPEDVWSHIQKLYGNGQHRHVHSYIRKVLETEHIPCIEKYMEKREKLKQYRGTLITTHRYLLNMEDKRLKEFDAVTVDEDILFKSVIANQEEIPVSRLKKILKKKISKEVRNKINRLLDAAEKQTCIELGEFELDDDDRTNYHFDMAAFCQAEHFFSAKSVKGKGFGKGYCRLY